MKKNTAILLSLSLLFFLCSAFSWAGVNLSGTWVGLTTAVGPDIDLTLTLTLEHKGDVITGKLVDDFGYINSEIADVVLKDDIFTFKVVADTPDGPVGLEFEMAVTENKIEGEWSAEDGVYGSWTATKKK